MDNKFLPGNRRGKYMRYDTTIILKRFHLCERALVINQAGWLPGVSLLETKTLLPKILWQDSLTGNELRERVFELRFPSRILEVGDDQPLVDLLEYSRNAPNELAFLSSLSDIFKPELKRAYEQYLELADEIGDGPTYRFLKLAIEEKEEQIAQLRSIIELLKQSASKEDMEQSDKWVAELKQWLAQIGGISLDLPKPLKQTPKAEKPFQPLDKPNRDARFRNVRFYWPDMIDPSFPYGTGMQLQIRSAVSHFNEVWAVENAGYVIYSLADELGWEFIHEASRWVYDESRHTLMGYARLKSWGLKDEELPLGTYIYDSCREQDPIYRLGMLFYFESKNIGKKIDRMKSFESMNDRTSQHDMDFDWADETIHTSYGRKYLAAALKLRGEDPDDITKVTQVCEQLVEQKIATATEEEKEEIRNIAEHLFAQAKQSI